MPYPNFHSCRLRQPNGHETRYAKGEREHEGKRFDVIYQRTGPKKSDPWQEQAYRYSAKTWTIAEARAHCKAHQGLRFEPAEETEASAETGTCVRCGFEW